MIYKMTAVIAVALLGLAALTQADAGAPWWPNGDGNCDGDVNAQDALAVLRHVGGLEDAPANCGVGQFPPTCESNGSQRVQDVIEYVFFNPDDRPLRDLQIELASGLDTAFRINGGVIVLCDTGVFNDYKPGFEPPAPQP